MRKFAPYLLARLGVKTRKELGANLRKAVLRVEVYGSRALMGQAAAPDVGAHMRAILKSKDDLSMVFAAPSQNEFLAALSTLEGIAWNKVVAFYMDEYVGLAEEAPQRFGNFLRERLFDHVKLGAVHYLDGNASDLGEECRRYARLLSQRTPEIVCLGTGENGHIAFNDPGVADFEDSQVIKIVELDELCWLQQVHEGCFPSVEAVPKQALTMTVPALTSGDSLYCIVPGSRKAEAVRETLYGPISEHCPASISRRHDRAVLYLDSDSARLLKTQ
jgi:glucosamine-6-phosphate deaminase